MFSPLPLRYKTKSQSRTTQLAWAIIGEKPDDTDSSLTNVTRHASSLVGLGLA